MVEGRRSQVDGEEEGDGEQKLFYSVDTVENQRIAAEEYLAHLAEKGVVKPNWWKEFLQRVREGYARFFGKEFHYSDADLETLIARCSRKMRKRFYNRGSSVFLDRANSVEGRRSKVEGDGSGARFAQTGQKPYYNIPFADSVDSVIHGSRNGEGLVFVTPTPDVLKIIGLPALPVMMTKQHILDIYRDYAKPGRNSHGLGEQLKRLPEMLEKPIAIISSKEDGRVVVITQYQDKNGKQIIVPVIIGTDTSADGGIRITANITASTFGNQNVLDLLDEAIEKEKNGEIAVFGANKKIASKLPMAGAAIAPTGGFNAIHNINDSGSPVKGKFKKETESLQFLRWFYGSKSTD